MSTEDKDYDNNKFITHEDLLSISQKNKNKIKAARSCHGFCVDIAFKNTLLPV